MCEYLGSTRYCSYYDVFFMKCDNCLECPDGLDNEDEEEEYYDEDGCEEY